jgi:hypothetical protein
MARSIVQTSKSYEGGEMASRLKEQLEAARQETNSWPAWRRMEIKAEVAKTPLRRQSEANQTPGKSKEQAGDTSGSSDL